MVIKAITFETMIADQKERIERNNLKQGDNLIMDYIINTNEELNA
jgi:hypothetical protein